jgi:hypothetical protein
VCKVLSKHGQFHLANEVYVLTFPGIHSGPLSLVEIPPEELLEFVFLRFKSLVVLPPDSEGSLLFYPRLLGEAGPNTFHSLCF